MATPEAFASPLPNELLTSQVEDLTPLEETRFVRNIRSVRYGMQILSLALGHPAGGTLGINVAETLKKSHSAPANSANLAEIAPDSL